MSVHLWVLQVAGLHKRDPATLRTIYQAQMDYRADMLDVDRARPWRRKKMRREAEQRLRSSVAAASSRRLNLDVERELADICPRCEGRGWDRAPFGAAGICEPCNGTGRTYPLHNCGPTAENSRAA